MAQTGWDATSGQLTLAEPWQSFWIRAYLDPPMGLYIDMQAALRAALAEPTEEHLDALIATLPPLIAEHNIVGRDGAPIEWRGRAMGSRLIRAIADALKGVQEAGEPADPLPRRSPGRRKRAS